ncbi:MAG: ATP-binding protein, partial [Bdellovibrionota bacterium]
ERLSELIGWTRYDTGVVPQEELEALRIREILEDRVPQLQALYPTESAALIECAPDLRLLAPRRVFLILMENLLINAFRHGTRGEPVRIVVNEVRLCISNGGNISEKVLARLGEPFNTTDSGGQSKGQGLGLAWVFSISRSLGWNFSIRQDGERVVAEIQFLRDEAISI